MNTDRQRAVLPLSLVAEGETVEVLDLLEQEATRQRLTELGLTPGATLRVVRADSQDGMIVAVRDDARLVIGRSTARKLMVCLTGAR